MSYFNGQRIDDDFQQQEPVKQERTFSLQDMVDAHREGAHSANKFCGFPSELDAYLRLEFSDYMKEKFNIDLNK